MNDNFYLEFVQKVLLEKLEPADALRTIDEVLKDKNTSIKSKNSCIKRLCRSYYDVKNNTVSYCDFAANLRNVILNYNRKFYVSPKIKQEIEKLPYSFGLEFYKIESFIEVTASSSLPQWLGNTSDFSKVYRFKKDNNKENPYGDSKLFNMTGYKYYSSSCQKFILRATMNQLEGTTILACMPTGGGKSLTAQMPAFYDKAKTTVVVVPTVALAIDQALSTEKLFKGKRCLPKAYYSGLGIEKTKVIFNELQSGKLSILYISPEALLNTNFNEVIMRAAEKGLVNRLVIDEAHIVTDWGDFFRTEFQFLSVFRRKLLEKSKDKLKTILLSATLSQRTTEVLKFLFSEENKFIEIRGDALRDEIIYYVTRNQNNYDRMQKVLDLLPVLPRPVIIYVSTIEESDKLKNAIIEKGFYSLETFTSKTDSNYREVIMKKWNLDQIDIMIATSAFGMGVDKKDVRGVIHCYVPENIDRFYQEVGRAGRDGFYCFSILNTSFKEDEEFINYLTRSKVLTVEKIISRWEEIKDKYIERTGGNTFWVDMDVAPHYLKDDITGSTSAAWNEYVVLFLYRKKLLDILDIKKDAKSNRHKLWIKILRNDLLDDSLKLKEYLEPIRTKEREMVDQDIHRIRSLVENKELCWSEFFTKVYSYAAERCCGCPVCRKNKLEEFSSKQYLEVSEGKKLLSNALSKSSQNINLDEIKEKETIYEINLEVIDFGCQTLIESIGKIIGRGVDNLIIPQFNEETWEKWISVLPVMERYYSIFNYGEFLSKDMDYLIRGTTVIVYDEDNRINDKLYTKVEKYLQKGYFSNVIHIAPKDYYMLCENRRLRDCIDGSSVIIDT